MDEEKKEYTLDDLEDIIREYSAHPRKDPHHDPATDETVRLRDPHEAQTPPSAQAADTIPLSAPTNDPDADMRIYRKEPNAHDAPPDPIPFPQNRDQILRKKLEDGPQQQYQRIDRNAPARMRAQMLLTLLAFVGCAATALLYSQTEGQRLKLMIFGQLIAMLLAAVVGYKHLLEGVTQMFHGHFRMESLLVVTLAVCWVDGLICIKSHGLPFSSVFILQMLMAQWAQYQKLQTRISQLDTLRKASALTAVVKNGEYYKHQSAYQEREGEPEEFTDSYREFSNPEKLLCRYAFGVVAAGAVLAVATAIAHGAAAGVRAYAAALLAATPATIFICLRRPLAVLEKRMHKFGIVLCGWRGVQNVEKQGFYPLTHADLFPEKHVKLNGVRFYGERNPNTVVSYVSALMKADGGSLAAPFEQLRSSRNARICKVEELTSYPGGVGGQIDGLSVIAGTLDFIEGMGVELSEVSRIPHAVYAAVNQSLCAVFAVNFSRSKSSAAGLRTLCESKAVKPILVDCDFVLTDEFLEQTLGVNVRRMLFPDCMTRVTLAQKRPAADAPVIALATRSGLARRAYAVTGAAALRSAWRVGTLVHILGGAIGFLAVAVLALHGDLRLLEAYNLLLYGFVWMIPGFLVTEWTRSI